MAACVLLGRYSATNSVVYYRSIHTTHACILYIRIVFWFACVCVRERTRVSSWAYECDYYDYYNKTHSWIFDGKPQWRDDDDDDEVDVANIMMCIVRILFHNLFYSINIQYIRMYVRCRAQISSLLFFHALITSLDIVNHASVGDALTKYIRVCVCVSYAYHK